MPQRKVLVVENEFILFDELVEFFEDKGFEVLMDKQDCAVDNYNDAVRLLRQHKPDIAVLDIEIKGDKDGIDIGAYIRQHFSIPVIYLSKYPSPGNLERIRALGQDKFIFRSAKDLDNEQLWSMFYLALPDHESKVKERTIGRMLNVLKVKVLNVKEGKQKVVSSESEWQDIRTFIKWDDILFIQSYNSSISDGNNQVLIHTLDPAEAYKIRTPLASLADILPSNFCQFNRSEIVNINKITARDANSTVYYIDALSFKLSDSFKSNCPMLDQNFVNSPL